MDFRPKSELTEAETQSGLRNMIWDGLSSEVMTTLTGSTFLVALALLLGASNLQIGILAALPTFTNIFQLISVWLVQKFNNRRAIVVICSLLARIPLVITGILILVGYAGIQTLISILFFYYLFASISGLSWNSWMKDLVPENKLGTYFARRGMLAQSLNVCLSIVVAVALDYLRKHYPGAERSAYAIFFIVAGTAGIIGCIFLSRTQEPESGITRTNMFTLMIQPLRNKNFRNLLFFNSAWVFALNIATPFFSVFMLKSMGLELSYIILLTILGQLAGILTYRMWGAFADRYSNKSIISIAAPIYIICIAAWCFVGIYSRPFMNFALLAAIHLLSGMATSGINLSLTNIGLKLAPSGDAIVYLSMKNMVTALFSSAGPLVGGLLADYFTDRSLLISAVWDGPEIDKQLRLISLHEWNFLFLIGALLAFFSMELLFRIKETGEVERNIVRKIMRKKIKSNLRDIFLIGSILSWQEQLFGLLRSSKKHTHEEET